MIAGLAPSPIAERLAEHVDWEDPGDCWICTYAKNNVGYPQIRLGRTGATGSDRKRNASAHRVAYELYVGPIPDGLCVLHRCDTPACVNPDHLYAGTSQDNMDDMVRRGRCANGGNGPPRKVSDEDATRIREMYSTGRWSMRELAATWKVSCSLVWSVVNGKKRFKDFKHLKKEKAT